MIKFFFKQSSFEGPFIYLFEALGRAIMLLYSLYRYVDKGAFKRKELWGKILLLEYVQQKCRQSRGALALSMQI